jgi:peptidyl-prolyl cis-trans isomerase B (cyclophilin B)
VVTKQQRQRRLARARFERRLERQQAAAERRRRRNRVIGAVVGVVVVAGAATWASVALTDDDRKPDAAPAAGQDTTVNTTPTWCAEPQPGAPNGATFPAEPAMEIDTAAAYDMVLRTSCGTVTIALDPAKAPRTVNSFAFLAGKQYFDHTRCHRLTTAGIYVLQCGDPSATGSGGPGYQLPDENLTGATYPAGTVAMANAGPNTGGSQFFLVYQDTQLGPNYTPFGRITGGLDVLQKIAASGTEDNSGDGTPHENVVLDAVTVTRRG